MMDQKYLEEIKAREQAAISYYEKRVEIEKQQESDYEGLGGEFAASAPLRESALSRHKTVLAALREKAECVSKVERLTALVGDLDAKNKRLVTAYDAYDGSALERADNYIENLEKEIATLKKALVFAINNKAPCDKNGMVCQYRELDCMDCIIQQAQEQEGNHESRK